MKTDNFLEEQYDHYIFNYSWNRLLEESFVPIEESFEKDVYKIETTTGKTFVVSIKYSKLSEIRERMLKGYMYFNDPTKGNSIEVAKKYEYIYENIPQDNLVMNISFTDSDKNIHNTGNVKNEAFSVFYSLIAAVEKSQARDISRFNKTAIIECFFDKNDEKRKALYLKILERKKGVLRKTNIIDTESDPKFGIIINF